MPFDSRFYEFYESAVAEFEANISMMFGADMIQLVKTSAFKDRGYFELSYKYVPLNYIITIHNEFRTFSISINDAEGASTFLQRIKQFDNTIEKKDNIKDAILFLKIALQQNNFNLYFSKNGKYYRKSRESIKRVKDMRKELQNDKS